VKRKKMANKIEKSENIKKKGGEKKKMWNKWSIEIAVIVCLTLLVSPLVGIAQATYVNPELITYPSDVKPIVDDPGSYPNTVILDTRGNADYNINHIPGAINIVDKFQYSPGNSTLKPVDKVTEILGDNGINESNEVIIYGTPYHYVFWMLEYLGHEEVSILDGGFETWNTTYPDDVTNVSTTRSPTTYTATPIESRIATTTWLLENYENPDVQILDVRRESEYNAGHIPGALNLVYELLWGENQMKSADELSDLFDNRVVDSKGEVVSLDKSKEIVVHCRSGGRASTMYFALRLMDYTVRNYEESMKIWDDELSLPLDIFDIKEDLITELEAISTTDKDAQKDIGEAIKHIEKSLEDSLWNDVLHLDTKHGYKVFDDEKEAVKHLMKAAKRDPTIADAISDVIDKLTKADDRLAIVAINDAKNTPVQDPKSQDKVDKEIAKAEEELSKAVEEVSKGKPDKAINHYKKAWEHAQHAIF
jgi:thiosulfate/3-mercaptopyruvate sulfurtransferase